MPGRTARPGQGPPDGRTHAHTPDLASVHRGLLALLALTLVAIPALADHSWASYHWARQTNPFTLQTGDNVGAKWDAYLDEAIADWNPAASLDLLEVAGGTNPKNCRPTSGQIEVCNAKYGRNGWLGLAQVWVSGNHITQGVAKLNDTYFDTATYDTPAWRRLVMCQELAHDFGLGHQDEIHNNANLGSCMDYTNDPDGGAGGASSTDPSNEHPNQHDYEQIETIYQSHTDSTTTVSDTTGAIGNKPSEWGRAIRFDDRGRPILFRRNLGDNQRVFTWVVWTLEKRGPDR